MIDFVVPDYNTVIPAYTSVLRARCCFRVSEYPVSCTILQNSLIVHLHVLCIAKMNDDRKQFRRITLKTLLQTKGKKQSDKKKAESNQLKNIIAKEKQKLKKKACMDENIRQGFENLVKFIESLK